MSAIVKEDCKVTRVVTVTPDDLSAPTRDGADWCGRWILIFLAVGVAARLVRYLLRFPLWGDEAMLAMNFIDRDYAGLLRPLNFHQVSPLLFLWTELSAVRLLGFNEWSLRLLPLLSSIASLLFFHRLARLLLRGTALVLAVGIFAVTYSGLRYAAEVKPYVVDQMVSTLLVLLVVRWWQSPDNTRWLWILTAVIPVLLGLSYPAVFVAGGASLAIATRLLRARSRQGWLVWAAYNIVLVGSFFAWYKLATAAQAGAELELMGRMWEATFPPRDSLLNVFVWLARVHTGPLLAVPVGGNHWGSVGTTLLSLVGVGLLLRQGRYPLLVLCSAPFVLNLVAAAMRRFPYGGHMRLAMHLAPLVCILAAIGAAGIFRQLSQLRSGTRRNQPENACRAEPITWPVATAIFALVMLAMLSTGRDFFLPGKEQQEIRKRDFAAWFWGTMERDHEIVSVSADLKQVFAPPGELWENCVSPQFLCNQQIYSPRLARGKSYDLTRVSRQRPLACVQYWSHFAPYDQAAFRHWLDDMQHHYALIGTERYPLLQDNDDDRAPEPADRVEVYEFVPL
jgi:hypothetical protein